MERGMVVLNEDDSELCVRGKIVSSLKSEYGLLGPNDFDIVKVTQKKISVLRLAEGTEYNYSVVKKLAGQGLLYIRTKKAYNFVLNESDSGQDQSDWLDEDLLESHRSAQGPPVPLHVMIRQGSSLVQVQVQIPVLILKEISP